MSSDSPFDAIVLAGGSARRLDGADKPGLVVGDSSLLEHVLGAVASARRRIVVGPMRPTAGIVTWCLEEPPGGGPLAAVAAGLAYVRADTVLVLAADLPWLGPAVPLLLSTLATNPPADAAMLIDADGRRNLLAAAWRREALERQVLRSGPPSGRPMRALCDAASIVEVRDVAGWGHDCDTWADLAAARHRADPAVTGNRFERQGR